MTIKKTIREYKLEEKYDDMKFSVDIGESRSVLERVVQCNIHEYFPAILVAQATFHNMVTTAEFFESHWKSLNNYFGTGGYFALATGSILGVVAFGCIATYATVKGMEVYFGALQKRREQEELEEEYQRKNENV